MTAALTFLLLAATPAEPPADPVEEVEEVVDLDSIEEPEYQPPPPSLGQVISRLHPALVHLPIGALLVVAFLELLALVRRRDQLHAAAWLVLAATAAAFVPAVATGWMQLAGMEESPRLELVLGHRNLMLLALALVLAALPLGRAASGARLWAYRGLVLGAVLVVTIGGHLGGKLVFGEHYLPF